MELWKPPGFTIQFCCLACFGQYRTIGCLAHPKPYPRRCTLAHRYNPTSAQDADEFEALQVDVEGLQVPFDVRRQRWPLS